MSRLLSLIGRNKVYEPAPRFRHYATPARGRCFLWGGCIQDFSASGRKKLASTVEIFDPYLEVWERQATSGVSPPGIYNGSCASLLDVPYSFGGVHEDDFYNCLHMLDPTSLQWEELRVQNPAFGPMKKGSSGMVAYGQDRLAMFGGYGIPTEQHLPTFIENSSYTDGRGWTNELHIFHINEGM